MPKAVKARPYRSPLREAQAEATRNRILDAALATFRQHGYAATSVRTIADEAGVSLQTLYQSIGSKTAVVEALLWRVKETIDLPSEFAAMAEGERDPHDLLRRSASISRRYSQLGWDVLELVRSVAADNPEIATIWDAGESRRYRGQTDVVTWIHRAGRLCRGLRRKEAADTLWTLSSHDTYRHYVADRGNTPSAFETWLYRTTVTLLLQPADATGAASMP